MMTGTSADEMDALARLAEGIIEAVVATEVQALQLMQAQMEACAKGAAKPKTHKEAALRAGTEAGFDNMPV